MFSALAAIVGGLLLLVWSADRFVEGAAATAKNAGMQPLLIGMLVVGFGTSAPEMLVSVMAAWEGTPSLALGNAFGSNIANIALILGLTAFVSPIAVQSKVLKNELPLLTGATLLVWLLGQSGELGRGQAIVLLAVFAAIMVWTVLRGRRGEDSLDNDMARELEKNTMPKGRALFWLVAGLVVLIASSRLLVWGAVEMARAFEVNELFIGLTIVAVGTSLPELASSLMAVRKNEHDLALGNVLGSNLFNTLAVVGLAGVISPMPISPAVMSRDMPVMLGLTLSLFLLGYGFSGRKGRISRPEGAALLAVYCVYTGFLTAMAMDIF